MRQEQVESIMLCRLCRLRSPQTANIVVMGPQAAIGPEATMALRPCSRPRAQLGQTYNLEIIVFVIFFLNLIFFLFFSLNIFILFYFILVLDLLSKFF